MAIAFMSALFVVGKRMRRYDLVDVGWGLVFIIITITALIISGDITPVGVLLLGMVMTWGLRLSSHIYRRLRTTDSEDRRYVELRKKWRGGNENVAIFFRIYVVQAVLATIICLPVVLIAGVEISPALFFVVTGFIVWALGLTTEVIADRQLQRFIHNPQNKGQLMTGGLWRYSRHPNYFGELLLWWGVGIIALGVPFGWVGLIGPATISYLIIFVSGVPPTEKAFAGRPGWDEYKQRTSVLLPWFTTSKKR
jgi:steroid 5-alpha reductase family enzyme